MNREEYPKILECGCLEEIWSDEGFNKWAGLPEGTEMIQTKFCATHKGTFKIEKEVEGYKL